MVSKRIICASIGPEGSCRYANIKRVNGNHYACCTHPETKRERIGRVEEYFPCYAPVDCPCFKGQIHQKEQKEEKQKMQIAVVEKKESLWSIIKRFFKW
ncbi:MAG: hypothetical protein HFJ28_06350 [Clostridia bacterium]|nr:hypothetical protein [Clostridia bacterium]